MKFMNRMLYFFVEFLLYCRWVLLMCSHRFESNWCGGSDGGGSGVFYDKRTFWTLSFHDFYWNFFYI